ncbi:MAG: hypothetical protein GY768_26410 [Planctomycetaceae bacterium]|nr:hypothetical protein [Planctomycetaceae bacterium]
MCLSTELVENKVDRRTFFLGKIEGASRIKTIKTVEDEYLTTFCMCHYRVSSYRNGAFDSKQ